MVLLRSTRFLSGERFMEYGKHNRDRNCEVRPASLVEGRRGINLASSGFLVLKDNLHRPSIQRTDNRLL